MSSFIQFIKHLVSGNTPQGIKCRTIASIIITIAVLVIEIVVYYTNWDSIPDMIQYDYDLSGIANNICEKKWIVYNLVFQMFICALVFIVKHFSYKIKRIHNIVYDKHNKLIPIINKRFSMFAWETAMLFVTTEQGYVFALIDIIKDRTADNIVTILFLFWFLMLVFEFRRDLKLLKAGIKKD